MSDKNIYQRINSVMNDCDYLKKESAGMGKGVRYDDVIAMLRPLMIKHGIVMRVNQENFSHREGLGGGKQQLYEGLYRLDLVNIDKPDDFMTQTATGQGMDNGDKGPGKCQTYAVKIMLVKGFSLETGEDDESRSEKMEAHNVISQEQYNDLESLLSEKINGQTKWKPIHRKVLAAYNVSDLRKLPQSKFNDAKARIKSANS